ncbi:MAG: ATP-dependent RNA helicase HrpA [Phycisphaerales bacterium]
MGCACPGRRAARRLRPWAIATRGLIDPRASRDATRAIVGCAVRFDDRTGPDTAIKLMTDGILLAETQRDRLLRQYDTIIVDEAHERSLNIDFLLGYLRQLLPRRPDLKVVITSATIDPRRFSDHFGEAPIIEVSGRMYPVEVRWRPVEARDGEDEDRALARATLDAVEEAMELDRERSLPPGDVLVFQSGEREIAETSEALRGRVGPDVEILPLFARLSSEDQDRVFQSPASRAGRRRIVLATNIAETSLTVPGIRYVVDPGFARISRFGTRTKVQRLPIEPISQASADQRKGRCGRTESGVCLRLYSEADHAARPRYTDPEILRTNLAAVILQMKTLRLGAIEQFPFIDPPSARAIASGEETLRELGALDADGSLTALGSELASYPIDPRLARMLIEARSEGCLAEMLVVAAALAVQDPRVRPSDRSGDADLAHLRFRDEQSDFVGLVKLWDAWRMKNDEVQRGEISGNALRRWARDSFLSYVRLREWQDVHRQLVRVMSKAATSAPRAGRRQWRRRT